MAKITTPSYPNYQPLIDRIQDPKEAPYKHLSFRLVELLPQSSHPNISCRLINTFIGEEEGNYEALSYVWGESRSNQWICINGQAVTVGENLFFALCKLQGSTARRFWIDAICIDQRDLQELSSQVSRMADIYKHAARTVVYLGELDKSTANGIGWVHKTAKCTAYEIEGMIRDQSRISDWYSVGKILDRPYWKRVWIAQEIAVSINLIVMIGEQELDFGAFKRLITDILVPFYIHSIHKDTHLELPKLQLDAVWAVLKARQYYKEADRPPTLAELIIMFLSSLSMDPRDKAYAFATMCRDPITPDYTLPLEEVFKSVVISNIRGTESLDILSAVNYAARVRGRLPSWCPDFTAPSPRALPSFTNDWRCAGDEKASGDNVQFDGSIMQVRGLLIDKIQYLCPTEQIHEGCFLLSQGQPHKTPYKLYANWNLALFDTLLLDSPPRIVAKAREQDRRCVALIYSIWFTRRLLEEGLRPWTYGFEGGVRKIRSIAKGRMVFLSGKGYVGLAPESAKVGDRLVVLFGSRVPLCIRTAGMTEHYLWESEGRRKRYEIIGDSYVHGIMAGEVMEEYRNGRMSAKTFILV